MSVLRARANALEIEVERRVRSMARPAFVGCRLSPPKRLKSQLLFAKASVSALRV